MKLKSLKIREQTHTDLAVFCAKNGYSIGDAADFIIRWAMAKATTIKAIKARHGKT